MPQKTPISTPYRENTVQGQVVILEMIEASSAWIIALFFPVPLNHSLARLSAHLYPPTMILSAQSIRPCCLSDRPLVSPVP